MNIQTITIEEMLLRVCAATPFGTTTHAWSSVPFEPTEQKKLGEACSAPAWKKHQTSRWVESKKITPRADARSAASDHDDRHRLHFTLQFGADVFLLHTAQARHAKSPSHMRFWCCVSFVSVMVSETKKKYSESRSPAPSSTTPRSCCWTRPRRPWTTRVNARRVHVLCFFVHGSLTPSLPTVCVPW